MGRYYKSNFGTISGKVGELVGSTWRGINYLRSLPTKSGKPASVSQLAVHEKIALSATQLSPIKDLLYIGFGDKKLKSITGYNAAVKEFIANSILGEYPDYTVDYANMHLSKGTLPLLRNLDMSLDQSVLTLYWTYEQKCDAFLDDTVIVVIYNKTNKRYDVKDSASRGDGTVDVAIDANHGDVLHIWIFCSTRDGLKVSPTQYVGMLTMPAPPISNG